MVQGRRSGRVAQLLRQELGMLLVQRVRDPAVQAVTVTDVQMSPDLTLAKVYFAVAPAQAELAQRGLDRAAPFLRRELGAILRLKRTPTLRFLRDEALEQGMHVDEILRELQTAEPPEEP